MSADNYCKDTVKKATTFAKKLVFHKAGANAGDPDVHKDITEAELKVADNEKWLELTILTGDDILTMINETMKLLTVDELKKKNLTATVVTIICEQSILGINADSENIAQSAKFLTSACYGSIMDAAANCKNEQSQRQMEEKLAPSEFRSFNTLKNRLDEKEKDKKSERTPNNQFQVAERITSLGIDPNGTSPLLISQAELDKLCVKSEESKHMFPFVDILKEPFYPVSRLWGTKEDAKAAATTTKKLTHDPLSNSMKIVEDELNMFADKKRVPFCRYIGCLQRYLFMLCLSKRITMSAAMAYIAHIVDISSKNDPSVGIDYDSEFRRKLSINQGFTLDKLNCKPNGEERCALFQKIDEPIVSQLCQQKLLNLAADAKGQGAGKGGNLGDWRRNGKGLKRDAKGQENQGDGKRLKTLENNFVPKNPFNGFVTKQKGDKEPKFHNEGKWYSFNSDEGRKVFLTFSEEMQEKMAKLQAKFA